MKKVFLTVFAAALASAAVLYGASDDYEYIRSLYGSRDSGQKKEKKQPAGENVQEQKLGDVVVTARRMPETPGAVSRSFGLINPKEEKLLVLYHLFLNKQIYILGKHLDLVVYIPLYLVLLCLHSACRSDQF